MLRLAVSVFDGAGEVARGTISTNGHSRFQPHQQQTLTHLLLVSVAKSDQPEV